MEYSGNSIYEYVYRNNLNYYYSAEHSWMLVYGNAYSIPKIMVFASKVVDINGECSSKEKSEAQKAFSIAKFLKLPFIFVRFTTGSNLVSFWDACTGSWSRLSYEQLRDIYEKYGVVQPGTAMKPINQYSSSPYHDWQRNNLGRITVSDFDLIKYANGEVSEIIELKRSKIPLETWEPYTNDYPNFALLINTIIGSGKDVPFTLYYNLMREGEKGFREEDISRIKVYDFCIPISMISCNQVKFKFRGYYNLEQLFNA